MTLFTHAVIRLAVAIESVADLIREAMAEDKAWRAGLEEKRESLARGTDTTTAIEETSRWTKSASR